MLKKKELGQNWCKSLKRWISAWNQKQGLDDVLKVIQFEASSDSRQAALRDRCSPTAMFWTRCALRLAISECRIELVASRQLCFTPGGLEQREKERESERESKRREGLGLKSLSRSHSLVCFFSKGLALFSLPPETREEAEQSCFYGFVTTPC